MTTNVKQGDLAVIVGCGVCTANNGRIVEVVRPFVNGELWMGYSVGGDWPAWVVRTVGLPLVAEINEFGTGIWRTEHMHERPYADRVLRPIRDPGDEAVDEMVRLVGKPKENTHVA